MKQYKDTPYFITETGEVYRNGKRLKPSFRNNYLFVSFSIDNKKINKNIHRLVAETYIPNPDNKSQVNHINGDKTDNRIDNLEWVTSSENGLHKHKVLKKGIGSLNGNSILTEKQVEYIKKVYTPFDINFGRNALSRLFNVDRGTISSIIHNKTWTHI